MLLSSGQQACDVAPGEPLRFTWSGVVRPEDVSGLFAQIRERWSGDDARVLWDMSKTQLIPGETRQRLLDELLRVPLSATAVITSSIYVRIPVTMVLEVAATEVVAKPPYRFFEEARTALAWLGSGSRDDGSNATLSVDARRIRRLITALSCASFDRFDSEEASLAPTDEDELGMLDGVLQLFIDELALGRATTARALRESEQARAEVEERLAIIEQQRQTIIELSSPVIDVWDAVLTLPIVGTLDSQRAAEMGDRLLSSVVERQASFVLLDLTGVAIIDTGTANHLVRLAQGVGLLGAECILTGISPQVAQTLAMLGVEWTATRTMRSLREALRYCIARQRSLEGKEHAVHVRESRRY